MKIYNKLLFVALLMINVVLFIFNQEHDIELIVQILLHIAGSLLTIILHDKILKYDKYE